MAPNADFAALKRFAIMPGSGSENTTLGPSQIRRVEATIEAELKVRGYVPASARDADFLVAYHSQMDDKLDDSRLGYSTQHWQTVHTRSPGLVGAVLGAPPSRTETVTWETGFDNDLEQYREGTLILDLVDARTHELIWRGWARRATNGEQLSLDDLRKAVTLLLERIPSRA